jgi:hypothetical protein
LNQITPDQGSIDYYTENAPTGGRESSPIENALVDLGCMTLGAVNQLITGEAPNGGQGSRVEAAFNIITLGIVGKEGGEPAMGGLKEMPSVKLETPVNGNSKASTNAQHNYDVVNTQNGNVVKTGTSGGKETQAGESYRGNSQANKWNKQEGTPGKYKSETTNRVPAGQGARQKALDYEKNRANEVRTQLDPDKHKLP